MVMVIWSLDKRMQVQILLSNPYSLNANFVDFIWSPYMKSKCSSKQNLMTTMIFLGPLSTNFYLFKNCELNYKFRKIDAHKYKWNHSTSEGAWFFSSHSWAIKPFISMYLNHPWNVKLLRDWVRYTSEYYKPSRTCERN